MQIGEPYLLNDKASAELLSISRASLWRRVKDGTLPLPIKLGRATRWRREELIDAINDTLENQEVDKLTAHLVKKDLKAR